MENVMTNGFSELSANEMIDVDGGKGNWGDYAYNATMKWCYFWEGVGGGVYTLTHPSTWFRTVGKANY